MTLKLVFLTAVAFAVAEAQVPERFQKFVPYCGKAFNRTFPENCLDLLCKLQVTDGVYQIYPTGSPYYTKNVYCDMNSDGGGWTTFLRRMDGEGEMMRERTWKRYETGIGEPSGNHFLGLQHIHQLSSRLPNELRVDLERWDGDKKFAQYGSFSVANATDNYRLNIAYFAGNVVDALAVHNGMQFSSGEKDNDASAPHHCAAAWKSGWWWNNCSKVRLLGPYLKPDQFQVNQGILWYHWDTPEDGNTQSLLYADMKMRPRLDSLQ